MATALRTLALLAFVALVGLVGLVGACQPQPSRLVLNTQRGMVLDPVRPLVVFHTTGELMVTLPGCTLVVIVKYSDRTQETRDRCIEPLADGILTTPWGRTVRGVSSMPDTYGRVTLRFPPDPKSVVALDPLDRRTWKLGKPWLIRHPLLTDSVEWVPSEAEVQPFIMAVGAGVGIDASTAPAVQPPDLVVTRLAASNDEILGGGPSVLELQVANRGQGPAYRVSATIRSSVAELHGLQFSFGKIEPGATALRRLALAVPENVEESSAMLVLVFQEANGFAPANFSKRFPVRVVATAPRLSVACKTASGSIEVDAGEIVRLRCDVHNDGGRPATAVTTVASVGGQRAASRATDVAPRTTESVDVPIRIPPGATIDQQLTIDVVASEPATGGQRAATRVSVTVRRPRVCPSGKLSRAAYRAKRAELERARTAGDLSADEFDRYDAELVSCLDE